MEHVSLSIEIVVDDVICIIKQHSKILYVAIIKHGYSDFASWSSRIASENT